VAGFLVTFPNLYKCSTTLDLNIILRVDKNHIITVRRTIIFVVEGIDHSIALNSCSTKSRNYER